MRICVVDDSVAIRVGVPVMLTDVVVVGTFASVESFLAADPQCDVVLLDLRLATPGQGGLQGIEAVRAVAERDQRICLYTDERRPLVLAQCLRAGAQGIAHKSDSAASVRDALERIAAGETVITQSLTGLAEVLDRAGGIRELTDRQREVLNARARGEQWSSIARRLYISESVAREHMAAVTAKFALHLQTASAADLERQLGVAPGDLLDRSPRP